MIKAMVHRIREVLIFSFIALFCKATGGTPADWWATWPPESASYCLSWRLAVEANNVRGWRTVPTQCLGYIETYMIGGQYFRDLRLVAEQILSYANEIVPSGDGMDAWIFDVDDTCISNILYYKDKRYGCDPYDPVGFKAWAMKAGCTAIPAVLRVYNKLIESGFKIILVTGRDEETMGPATIDNIMMIGTADPKAPCRINAEKM